ncbi:hypothetical protein ACXGQW_04910 [Wenyingzhuangia sp. IMCC45533]
MKVFKVIVLFSFLGLLSCEGVLLEEDISDKKIKLIAPSNNSKLENRDLHNFSWEEIDVETDYQIQLARPNFTNPDEIVLDSIVSNHRISLSVQPGNYEWRVRAKNSAYTSAYTSPFLFEVESSADNNSDNETVILFSPSDNSSLERQDTYNFSWEELNIATSYQIQIVTPDFSNPMQKVVDSTLSATDIDVELNPGTYQWRVRGSNNNNSFDYGNPFNFSIIDGQ